MKVKIWGIVVLIIIASFLLTGYIGIEIFKNKTTDEVKSYLIEQKGYKEDDIIEIQTVISKTPIVSTSVVFKDELNARYFYKKDMGRIEQYTYAPATNQGGRPEFKHKEKDLGL
ncbi:DUF3139 domain-containing protein [Paenibacillus medicaginis]|uniref:DUF3139 domain-containing protein n=1 Tax=Paenibacillus medicaginis TaxID=1470560 RepID=A0ABV5C805_9BACL